MTMWPPPHDRCDTRPRSNHHLLVIALVCLALFAALAFMFWRATLGDVLPGRLKF